MTIEYFRIPKGLLYAKPRFTPLQICLYAIIDSECRNSVFKWISYNPKILQRLVTVVLGKRKLVHEGSIERAIIKLWRRKWISKRKYLPNASIVLALPDFKPELTPKLFRQRMLSITQVPTEAMANPKLSYTAKLAFGGFKELLGGGETTELSNEELANMFYYLRKRSLVSAIPELAKQKYIFIRNPRTRRREIGLNSRWDIDHTEHKENYRSIRPQMRSTWIDGAKGSKSKNR